MWASMPCSALAGCRCPDGSPGLMLPCLQVIGSFSPVSSGLWQCTELPRQIISQVSNMAPWPPKQSRFYNSWWCQQSLTCILNSKLCTHMDLGGGGEPRWDLCCVRRCDQTKIACGIRKCAKVVLRPDIERLRPAAVFVFLCDSHSEHGREGVVRTHGELHGTLFGC